MLELRTLKIRILMGLPGAGKSSWIAAYTFGDVTVCSTDHFHTTEKGYNHPGQATRGADGTTNDGRLMISRVAHGYCLRKYITHLQAWENSPTGHLLQPPSQYLVVDNTNTTVYEIGPYLAAANAFGLGSSVEVHYLKVTPETSKRRNTHNVPDNVVDLMAANLETLVRDWPMPWPRPIVHDTDDADGFYND